MAEHLDVPLFDTIAEYLPYYAEREPARDFLVFGDKRISYGEAADAVGSLARGLQAEGVDPGDRVATLSTPRPEFVLSFLATLKIGGIWVGLNPKYTIHELRHVVSDSSPRVILGLLDHGGRDYRADIELLASEVGAAEPFAIGPHRTGVRHFDDLSAHGAYLIKASDEGRRPPPVGPLDPALIVYTSGTTGKPKGAVLSHRSLVWSFHRQGLRWGIDGVRTICNLPINHSACVGDVLSSSLVTGGTIVLMETFDPDAMLEVISREQVNVLVQIPTMYQMLASRPLFSHDRLASLSLMIWGGAAMPGPVLRHFERPGLRCEVMYGQTEAPASITVSRPDATFAQLTETIGVPDPEMEVRIAGPDGSPCNAGAPGEIQVRHDSVFLGYHKNPGATSDAFTADGFLRTGDLAVLRPDGYVQMVGRLKEMFKSGGYNVYPREIELCLELHPDVMAAVVVEGSDPTFGEVGHAFVIPGSGRNPLPSELRAWCDGRLANYKVPKTFRLLGEFPMLPIGKPDKGALRLRVQDASGDVQSA